MIQANISSTKAHLSQYLERVKAGQTILIVDRSHPVAILAPCRAAEGTGTWMARTAELTARGQLKPPSGPASLPVPPAIKKTHGAGVVAALLEERREGR